MSKTLASLLAVGGLLSLAGCYKEPEEKAKDSAPIDTSDDVVPEDTGVMYLFIVAGGTHTPAVEDPPAPASLVGKYGAGWYGIIEQDWVCVVTGDWASTDVTPKEGCPECVWSFDMRVSNTQTDGGLRCDISEEIGLGAGFFDYAEEDEGTSYGWADAFDFYGDGSIIVENSLLFQYTGRGYDGWYASFFNAAAYDIQMIYGDATSFDAFKGWRDTAGNQFYYYYYL